MEIKKRDGRLVKYDGSKIIGAVAKAMKEVTGKVDKEVCYRVEEEVLKTIKAGNYPLTVEGIQDSVVNTLLSIGSCNDVAIAYIEYKTKRDIVRGKEEKEVNEKYPYLGHDFLKLYITSEDPFPTELGKMVYYRTYSRPIPEENRRERWWETVARVVNYSSDLEVMAIEREKGSLTPNDLVRIRKQAREIFDLMYNLKLFPSGRSLWIGGTKSAYDNPIANFNCFSSDTEFITDKGIKSFDDFNDGDKVNVLNANGAWSEATVTNFGEDELVELKLRKGRRIKTIETTNNHIWFVHKSNDKGKYIKKETRELQIGDQLREKRRYESQSPVACNVGIQHGIVYGDGTYDKKKNFCSVSLVGDKQKLSKYMHTGSSVDINNGEQTRFYGLPNTWKQLPSIEEMNLEYLYGFLIGYFATDGSVTNNTHTISSSKREDLEFVRDVCSLVGMSTGDIRLKRETNPFDGSHSPLYEVTILSPYILDDFLINPKHKDNSKGSSREMLWTVESIENTGKKEPVWCVQEPETNAFTLADDILTHNCSFVAVNELEVFSEMFLVLMLGTGVGLSIQKEYIEQLPKINTNINIVHKDYTPVAKSQRTEFTQVKEIAPDALEIVIGDSKGAWSKAMQFYMEIVSEKLYKDIRFVLLNYDNIRPAGEPLKTFGGTASGHNAIKTMFGKIDNVFKTEGKNQNKEWVTLKPINALDIATSIAENVVSGGVRRSALIVFADEDEKDVLEAKNNLYKQEGGQWVVNQDIIHRQLANITILYKNKPKDEQLENQFDLIRFSGEPAFGNFEEMLRRRPDVQGGNP